MYAGLSSACVSMSLENSCLLTFKAHALGFACSVLVFPIRVSAQKEGNRKWSLAMDFWE